MFFTNGSPLPRYLPYPAFLLDSALPLMARQVYALLLDRATLSRRSGWLDQQGRVYVVYPILHLCAALGCGVTAAKSALAQLERAGLIQRRRGRAGQASQIFLKLPTAAVPAPSGPEIRPSEGRKSGPLTAAKPSPSNLKEQPNRATLHQQLPVYTFEEGESL